MASEMREILPQFRFNQLGRKVRLTARLPAYGEQADMNNGWKYKIGNIIRLACEIYVLCSLLYLEKALKNHLTATISHRTSIPV
jgi:hypothetical protein